VIYYLFKKKPSTRNQSYYFMLLNIMEQMPHNGVSVRVRPMFFPIVSSSLSFCLEFVSCATCGRACLVCTSSLRSLNFIRAPQARNLNRLTLVECSYSRWIGRLEWIGIEFKAFYFCDTSRVIFADASSHFFQSNPDPCHPEWMGLEKLLRRGPQSHPFGSILQRMDRIRIVWYYLRRTYA
jgi:hypothetical protein